ncbi:MAG: 30S ribosomal protein S9 [Candidatus Moranbacteria bacterium]|nr:30S ribosomal protein S9 [Candidatus Moranbacteria bacterium]
MTESNLPNKSSKQDQPYFYAVGRRKTSSCRVRLYANKAKDNQVKVNDTDFAEYFTTLGLQKAVTAPFKVAGERKFKALVKVNGGGIRGQAEAIKLGIARALVKCNQDFRKQLKSLGYLTRDPRVVERKKAGLKKARRAPQFSKR